MSDTHIPASLRREVIERAKHCCEYCRLHQADNFFTFHVDHIISEKHGGSTISGNATFLYNPRQQIWAKHLKVA